MKPVTERLGPSCTAFLGSPRAGCSDPLDQLRAGPLRGNRRDPRRSRGQCRPRRAGRGQRGGLDATGTGLDTSRCRVAVIRYRVEEAAGSTRARPARYTRSDAGKSRPPAPDCPRRPRWEEADDVTEPQRRARIATPMGRRRGRAAVRMPAHDATTLPGRPRTLSIFPFLSLAGIPQVTACHGIAKQVPRRNSRCRARDCPRTRTCCTASWATARTPCQEGQSWCIRPSPPRGRSHRDVFPVMSRVGAPEEVCVAVIRI